MELFIETKELGLGHSGLTERKEIIRAKRCCKDAAKVKKAKTDGLDVQTVRKQKTQFR
ncbi:hypothetical protein BWQ96_00119 [Gracilariopsis chorda]|uniref:Uncharacterized protein n=1 Tax=Gracilariopsis chorda TaxID=448386 RepID=A0A2V3J6C8_9FLOR|nr:hypothetical protein BWQ96_00119 [Gracilariopsis chorda]|eukprot:PXF49959.1 hypothetical protein BWQ96_00119 [Gracilariopsis chorda]